MHNGVDPPIQQAIFGLEARYPKGARSVMPPTTTVRSGKTSQLGVFSC